VEVVVVAKVRQVNLRLPRLSTKQVPTTLRI
jgi:hypothetical protein